jgi:hypothetical protein
MRREKQQATKKEKKKKARLFCLVSLPQDGEEEE